MAVLFVGPTCLRIARRYKRVQPTLPVPNNTKCLLVISSKRFRSSTFSDDSNIWLPKEGLSSYLNIWTEGTVRMIQGVVLILTRFSTQGNRGRVIRYKD